MNADRDFDIIIVSDLHLSSGHGASSGSFEPSEQFSDSAFARFLEHLEKRSANGNTRLLLLILGDLFDFPTVETDLLPHACRFLARTVDAALDRLDRIAEAHPQFFRALGAFLDAGGSIGIVVGNHDVEMLFQPVQERIRHLITTHTRPSSDVAGSAGTVTFYPWIYYIEGLLYAEHGQQYEPLSSFTTLLQPYHTQEPADIDVPLGVYFDQYKADFGEALQQFAGGFQPSVSRFVRFIAANPGILFETLPCHVWLVRAVLTNLAGISSRVARARRRAYYEKALPRYAMQVGLQPETLEAIARLGEVSGASVVRYLAQRLAFDPLSRLLPALAAALSLYLALHRGLLKTRRPALGASGLLWLAWRNLRKRPAISRLSRQVQRAAPAIHRLLQNENRAVPFYVFGHTHEARQVRLVSQPGAPYYLNSGTWHAPLPSSNEQGSVNGHRFPFIEISSAPEPAATSARLFAWNDTTGRVELLPEQPG